MAFLRRRSDKEKIHLNKGDSLLFVCYGNTCRSPMAEGLAKKMLGPDIRVESAGINPIFEGASPDSIRIMGELFEVDISAHKARNILSVKPEEFDHVFVLDRIVYQVVKSCKIIPPDHLHLWCIEDPFQKSGAVFKRVAETLKERIQNSLEMET